MDAVKKYLIWIIVAVLTLGSLGGYFYLSSDLDSEIKQLQTDNQGFLKTVEGWAKAPQKIQNQAYVDAAKDFDRHLKRQEDDIKKAWDGKGLTIPDLDAAPTDLIEFDTKWLAAKRTDILAKAKSNSLTLPKDFETAQLYLNSTTADAATRKLRIRNITLIAEIIDILTSTRVQVQSVKFTGEPNDKNPGASETTETRSRGAVALDELLIVEEKDQATREKAAYESGLRAGGASTDSSGKEPPPLIYTALQIELRFTAAFPAVPSILQKLESSRVWFGLVRKIDTQRVAKPFADPSEFGLFPPAGRPKEEGDAKPAEVHYFNTRYDEAPVQVLATMDMLTYAPIVEKKASK